MTPCRQTRLACFFCNEYLVGKREDDSVRNCFGFSYGPRENPFLNPKHKQKVNNKAPTDPIGLQTILLKCGHIFHKGCLKKSIQRENGSISRMGNCPICQKSFILGKTMDIKLKVCESEKVAEKRQKDFAANEQKRLGIRTEIERLQNIISIYQKGFTQTRQTIVSDSHSMLTHIRQIRQRKRLLDQFQRARLDPLEEVLDEIYDENNLWKQLLGKPMKVDNEGFYIATPHAPCPSCVSCTATEDELPFSAVPAGAKPSSPSPMEFLRGISSPLGPDGDPRVPRHDAGRDYSGYWNLLPTPPGSAQKDPEELWTPGRKETLPLPTRDSESDYDIAAFAAQVRNKIQKQTENKERRKPFARIGIPKDSPQETEERGFPYTPLSEEHWEESDSEIGSDYKMDSTSIVGSAELGKRCDVGRILDPDRALRKWRQMLGLTLKFDYKYENGLINWQDDFPHFVKIGRAKEQFMLRFIEQKWK